MPPSNRGRPPRKGGKKQAPRPGEPVQGQLFDLKTGKINPAARVRPLALARPTISHPEMGRGVVEFPGHPEWGRIGIHRNTVLRARSRVNRIELDFPTNGNMDLRIYRVLLNQILRKAGGAGEIGYDVDAETITENPNIEHLLHSAGFVRKPYYNGDKVRDNLRYAYTLNAPFHKIPKRPMR